MGGGVILASKQQILGFVGTGNSNKRFGLGGFNHYICVSLMAVYTHYPSPNTFSSGAGIGMRSSNNIWEEFQQQHHNASNVLGQRNLAAQMLNVAVFSEPESELTCNASIGRKRPRENQMEHHHQYRHHRQMEQSKVQVVLDNNLNFYEPGSDSGPASTSGRREQMGSCSSYLCTNRDLELEALIRFQNEKLRLMAEEGRKRQSRSLLGMIEQQTMKRLMEKETELERANRANVELQEKVKQMSVENQMWFNVAKNSEATIASLRASLEQILLHNNNQLSAEGFGENDEAHSRFEAEQSKSCKGCGRNDASFLVLPCRHLCLCGDCEVRERCCPVCNAVKNSTLQVFTS